MAVNAGLPELEAFDRELEQINIRGQWLSEARIEHNTDGPTPVAKPHIWRYADVMEAMEKARTAFPDSLNARRSLMFSNPGLPGPMGNATSTIAMGIQLIEPGELAWPHRHTATALRFVIEGDPDLATVVDGKPQVMEDYDLILTPKWTWHGHHNQSDHMVSWVDILDVPMIGVTNQMFYQASADTQLVDHLPSEEQTDIGPARSDRVSPIYRFAWKDIEPKLYALAKKNEVDPFDGIVYRYAHPETGGSVLNLLDCRAQLFRPGDETKPIRRAINTVYFVIRGEGKTIVNGEEIRWGKHDSFVVPNWTLAHHVNDATSEDAILFSVNDRPLVDALDLYCERTH